MKSLKNETTLFTDEKMIETYNTSVYLFPKIIPFPMSEKLTSVIRDMLREGTYEDNYNGSTESYFVMCGGQFYVAEMYRLEDREEYELMDKALPLATDWLTDEKNGQIRRNELSRHSSKIKEEMDNDASLHLTIDTGKVTHPYIAELFISFSNIFFKMQNI